MRRYGVKVRYQEKLLRPNFPYHNLWTVKMLRIINDTYTVQWLSYGAGRRTHRGSTPSRGKALFCATKRPDWVSPAPNSLLFSGYRGRFPAGKETRTTHLQLMQTLRMCVWRYTATNPNVMGRAWKPQTGIKRREVRQCDVQFLHFSKRFNVILPVIIFVLQMRTATQRFEQQVPQRAESNYLLLHSNRARIAQSVCQLTMGWQIRGSHPAGGNRFSLILPFQTGPGAHPASSTHTGALTGDKAAEAWRPPPKLTYFRGQNWVQSRACMTCYGKTLHLLEQIRGRKRPP
jgi:hypothetical protein